MTVAIVLLFIIALLAIGILVSPKLTQWWRDRLQKRSFLPRWNAILETNLPIYSQLTPIERRRLQGHILVFLTEKQFIGCAGLRVTEEMKLTIAAVACLLLLNGQGNYFPRLRSILVYPDAYLVQETTMSANHIVEERRVIRLGESWTWDQVVLSWKQVQYDTQHWQDGHNVVLHEFAHQLDQADGRAEGVPVLQNAADYASWAVVMTEAYQRLCKDVQRGAKTVLDSYGTTNPAEFFAVATETFFEQPRQLLNHYPALYAQLQRYYQLDPRQWF